MVSLLTMFSRISFCRVCLVLVSTLFAAGCSREKDRAVASGENKPAATESTNRRSALRVSETPITPVLGTNAAVESASKTSTETNGIALAEASNDPKRTAVEIYNAAVRHFIGDGVSQSISEAVKNFALAADKGHPGAQHNLAVLYLHGRGVEKDPEKARELMHKAAKQGLAEAQFKLASLYAAGIGIAPDLKEAAVWVRQAAEQGHPEAEYNLATLYVSGRGVEKNLSEAAQWYRKAAEKGKAAAQSNLGFLYATGQGVAQDPAEAVQWFRKAAEQGHPTAQFNLARAHVEGKVVTQDLIEAYKWYLLSAGAGDQDAQREQSDLRKNIGPSDLAEAIRRANAFSARFRKSPTPGSDLVLPSARERPEIQSTNAISDRISNTNSTPQTR
jgi:TPR repeat protein